MRRIPFEFSYKLGAINVRVEGNYIPSSKGTCDSLGVPLEPDDPAEYEVLHCWHGLKDLDLTEDDIEELVAAGVKAYDEKLCEEVGSCYDDDDYWDFLASQVV